MGGLRSSANPNSSAMSLPPRKPSAQDSYPLRLMRANFSHLYGDIFWLGLLSGSTLAFLAVYAARLGASSLQLGLVAAGPAAVNLLFTLPAGRWLEGQPLVRTAFTSSLVLRLGYVILIGLPWLALGTTQVWLIVLISLAMSIPATLLTISFNALLPGIVPSEHRAEVVGRRNALVAVSATFTTLLSGQILVRLTFPLNDQIVFFTGAVGALMSSYHVSRLRALDGMVQTAEPGQWRRSEGQALQQRLANLSTVLRSESKRLVRWDLLRGPFGPFLLSYLAFYTFQNMPFPLFTLLMVNSLKLSDNAIGIGQAMFNGLMTLASLWLGKASSRFGHRRIMVVTALLFWHYPVLLAVAKDASLYWLASFTGGILYAFLSGAMLNRLMERVPENDRPAHMALHNMALNLGILIGSFLGPAAAAWLGLRDATLASGALRFLAAILLVWWG